MGCKGVELVQVLRARGDATEIDVLVSPGASRTAVTGVDQWRKRLQVKVRAPPEGGRANEELEEFLGEVIGAKVVVEKGHTARMKTLLAQAPLDQVRKKLEAAL
jgi:uncharacterized protein (TIGR00251 family)